MSNKIETIYLIHHSHTDIGYTQDQPIVWEMQSHFIDEAIDLAEKYQAHDTDGAFRWTIETTSMLEYWLKYASFHDIDRLVELEHKGRIEVTGMFANITPLYDADQVIESFQILKRLREDYGFTINNAMNCDVNGQNWSLPDVLLDLGITGFTMAINTHFGGAFKPRPYTFKWEAPSGRTILTNNGWTYDKAWREGIGRDIDEFKLRWQRLQTYLDDIGYPLPILLLQSYHPYGDNGSAFDFTPFIDQWNNEGNTPRIVMATPRMWWQAVSEHENRLQTFRGDWTDFWNFGSISSAHEQRLNRLSRAKLRNADTIYAALNQLADAPKWAKKVFNRHRKNAWHQLNFWDEHTWGADTSIIQPDMDDTRTQWNHKADYAHKARSLSTLLQREALGDFAMQIPRENADDIIIFNPLPWSRTLAGAVPYFVTNPRGVATDTTAGRHHQDREVIRPKGDIWNTYEAFLLPPTEIPALGYTVVERQALISDQQIRLMGEDKSIENHRYIVTFDRTKGGITSIYDKQLDWELVDATSDFNLNNYIHEEVADKTSDFPRKLQFHQEWDAPLAEIPDGWQKGWHARRESVHQVITHKVYQLPYGTRVIQTIKAKGIDGELVQQVFLPDYDDYIECSANWNMTLSTHPEASYIAFPFNVPDATARYDIGNQAVQAENEQLPGACRDYFTVQGWVDFNNGSKGITIATPENPMVQLGDFHFGHYQSKFELERSLLLGWITNNYWETNFRAHQPGQVQARYRILPYSGGFNESQAHQLAANALHHTALFQHLGEPFEAQSLLPANGSLLNMPDAPIIVMHIKQADDDTGVIVRLVNASDSIQTATLSSNLLQIQSAELCDLTEAVHSNIDVVNGSVSMEIESRHFAIVKLVLK